MNAGQPNATGRESSPRTEGASDASPWCTTISELAHQISGTTLRVVEYYDDGMPVGDTPFYVYVQTARHTWSPTGRKDRHRIVFDVSDTLWWYLQAQHIRRAASTFGVQMTVHRSNPFRKPHSRMHPPMWANEFTHVTTNIVKGDGAMLGHAIARAADVSSSNGIDQPIALKISDQQTINTRARFIGGKLQLDIEPIKAQAIKDLQLAIRQALGIDDV